MAVHHRCYEKGQWVVHPDHRLAALTMRRRTGQRETEFDALDPVTRQFHLKLLPVPVEAPLHLRRLLGSVRLYGRKAVLATIVQCTSITEVR